MNLERREITVRAINAKTRTARILPISSRLLATLEMRKLDPAGRPFGLEDLQLRDLRHEAGSRFDEAGVSTNYVSKLLGHASLSTTTRYLNIQRRGLHLAMEKLEESQKAAADERRKRAEVQERKNAEPLAHPLHTTEKTAPAFVSEPDSSPSRKRLPS